MGEREPARGRMRRDAAGRQDKPSPNGGAGKNGGTYEVQKSKRRRV